MNPKTEMHKLPIKIISGGQTGADQGALKAALDCGVEIGGYCPPGRVCENGVIPSEFTLTETTEDRSEKAPHVPRSGRTELNVIESDGTLIIKPSDLTPDAGTRWTMQCSADHNKPYLVIDSLQKIELSVSRSVSWLSENRIKVLNVAGPAESNCPGIYEKAYEIMRSLIRDLN